MLGKHSGSHWVTSDGRVSNLSLAKTRCKCGRCDSNSMQQRIIDLFQALRDKVGKPITPTSGMRCAAWNQHEGGTPKSQHLYGNALDLLNPSGYDTDQFAEAALSVGITAVGRYKNRIHIDGRPGVFRWDMRVQS